jgi:23S rRNA (cytidine1920-2'-O)/16S rRNA (cytidine1409-2'-O)-methyltransferase
VVKERVDVLLFGKGLAPSREKAQVLIMAGEVYIGNEQITKADKKIEIDTLIEVRGNPVPYVSYGGVKLKKALDVFALDLKGKRALDIGSSTGGFTDCLLQTGVSLVHTVDAGTHQLHEKLRNDTRIIVRENCNARYLKFGDLGEKFDIITIDVSFISLKKILPVAIQFLKDDGHIISLVKPQFEVGRFEVGKGGIVKSAEKIEAVITDMKAFGKTLGIHAINIIESPREKEKKNREYFILWEPQINLSR